jgi:hypothetical protein
MAKLSVGIVPPVFPMGLATGAPELLAELAEGDELDDVELELELTALLPPVPLDDAEPSRVMLAEHALPATTKGSAAGAARKSTARRYFMSRDALSEGEPYWQPPTSLPALRNGTHVLPAGHSPVAAVHMTTPVQAPVGTQAVPVMLSPKWFEQVIPFTGSLTGIVTISPALGVAQHTGLVGSTHSLGSSHSQRVPPVHVEPLGTHDEGTPESSAVLQHTWPPASAAPGTHCWLSPPSTALNGQ